jgi:1,4-dihydroxy-2-naphthoate octaprenyltransferase
MATVSDWIAATRPKTFPASVIPVVLGVAAAYHQKGEINILLAVLTIICSMGIQILTGFINEIYDFKKGADTAERVGPKRAVAAGIITVKQMTIASYILGIATFLLGMIIVYQTDYIILVIGLVSLFLAYGYTAGPAPLAYLGIADIFVLVFFGLVAVNGTYYVQTGSFSNEVFWMSVPLGLFATNILCVNNIRDHDVDKKAKKLTLPVRIGIKNALVLYVVVTALAYFIGIYMAFTMRDIYFALPVITLPLGVKVCFNIYRKKGEELNKVLVETVALMLFYGILLSLVLVIKTVLRI